MPWRQGGGGVGDPPAFPLVVPMPLLAAADNLIIIPWLVPANLVAGSAPIGGHLQAITAGSFVVDVKNDGGTELATLTWTAAGAPTVSNRNVSFIGAGDSLHFNCTSLGTAPLGATVVIWLRVRG